MPKKRSQIGKLEEQLYVAANGCYVVSAAPLGWGINTFDLRGPRGNYIGDGIYGDFEKAKRGADLGGETLYKS